MKLSEALHIAAKCNRKETVELLLLLHGANINEEDKFGKKTALHIVSEKHSDEIIVQISMKRIMMEKQFSIMQHFIIIYKHEYIISLCNAV
ncbi:hypothetical protein TVAG_221810 [Trichomonas vaginalis G3]|uniref:Uncharacterized protein n=1 Tax=Trichomonas vaginalis (strain ATCC PRA-98 / G3) TaxID=412133 RepID=A2E3D7_TRIV3|nr:protein ubiquitination [Trichomonas vaginalis G3]EAY12828.1 hypothetical protein TVAG_221810 [Trichomonas vaginalis G3]KAI5488514.1 protein ubiquitination [Trichomonas vaginalis G3]|eukprot:XP_001325051.1 hypothetical protein [Trichomonas vaginalis G3]